jgi:hydrogenase-4 component B
MAIELFELALICLAAGTLIGVLALFSTGATYVSAAGGVVGSALLASSGAVGLIGRAERLAFPSTTPLGGFEFRSSPLPGAFLLLTGVLGVAIAIYSAGYGPQVGGRTRQAALICLLNPALASLAGILLAGNALTFLLAWEVMSLLTYVLVAIEYEHREAPRAAFLMLALSEIGFVAVLVAFALIGGFSGRDFAELAADRALSHRNAAFVLLLFGFGAKAGLIPLQGWLPEAHPAAPSNISALLSAVVVKMAIYGLLLTTVVILGPPATWWGYVALILGVVTAIYGILFSLVAPDLKRALAFSTIENLGFMVAMLGAALLFRSLGQPLLEALAITALVLHALNHALLKGGLFLGAGSVQAATGTRDMDRLGGLGKRMPWTTAAFFLCAMGIAGVPPMNGFQSEWLGLQVLLQSHLLQDRGARLALATSGAVLALTFALALTTYIRIIGGAFLGRARSHGAEQAREAGPAMVSGMALPALLSVVLGLMPPIGVGIAATAAQNATGVHGVLNAVLPPIFREPGVFSVQLRLGAGFLSQVLPVNGLLVVPADASFSSIAPTYIFIVLAVVIAVTALVLRALRAPAARVSAVWDGAVPEYTPGMQYTATGFTNLLRFIFGGVYRSEREIEGDYQQAPFFARTIRYSHRVVEPIETYVYRPVARGARRLSQAAAPLQAGNVSLYLLYLFLVFLVAIFVR